MELENLIDNYYVGQTSDWPSIETCNNLKKTISTFNFDIAKQISIFQCDEYDIPSSTGRIDNNIYLCKNIERIKESGECTKSNAYVYEFSHELCHLSFPHDFNSHMRWMEETICQLASFIALYEKDLFLRERSQVNFYSVTNMIPNKIKKIKHELNVSIDNFMKKNYEEFFNATTNQELDGDELRFKLHIIAEILVPIFNENPNIWKETPLLCNLNVVNKKIRTFYLAMNNWKNNIQDPKNKNTAQQIIDKLQSQDSVINSIRYKIN